MPATDTEYQGGPVRPTDIRAMRLPDGQQILVRGDFNRATDTLRYVNGAWQKADAGEEN